MMKLKKVYLDEIRVTVKLYNTKLREGLLDNLDRAMYCGRFLAILGIILGDDDLHPYVVEEWSEFLNIAATHAARGEVI